MNSLSDRRHHCFMLAVVCSVAGLPGALAQSAAADSAFLACSRFEDRGQRIACLEDALEAAAGTEPVADMEPATSNEASLLERIRNFGRSGAGTDISINADGQERLHDSISTLAQRNNLWIVTLASGQVWRQTYPRTLLLKEGDSVEIYREGIGNGFRLATPRLNGFIRVERVE